MTTPLIVISSNHSDTGKTTLALNLAAALWSDGYHVMLYAPHNSMVDKFMQKRIALTAEKNIELPMPKRIDAIMQDELAGKNVIIADIPSAENSKYADIFAQAHTLITIEKNVADFQWEYRDMYMNLIWNAKKEIAARGIKYLNWIALLNYSENLSPTKLKLLETASKKFGFRIAEPLHRREAFEHIKDGFCAADMILDADAFKMTLADVYARREILTLTDFLWQEK